MTATVGCRCREVTPWDCCVAIYFGLFAGLYGALSLMSVKAAMIGFMVSPVAAFLIFLVFTGFRAALGDDGVPVTYRKLERKLETAAFFAMSFFGTIVVVRAL